MEASIKLDAESFAGIASAAIFDSLTEEARGDIIKQALEHLLTPESNRGFGVKPTTPIQQAFNQAIQSVAFKVVRDKIENDPTITAEIEKLIGPMVLGAIDVESETHSTSLADAIGGAVGTWLAEAARLRRDNR